MFGNLALEQNTDTAVLHAISGGLACDLRFDVQVMSLSVPASSD
jgi:hypothetical protein